MFPEELADLCEDLEWYVDGVDDGGIIDGIVLTKEALEWILDQIYLALED